MNRASSARAKKFGPNAAIEAINSRGALLVFPVANRPEPRSLWSEFFPKSKMVWEWNDNSDDRVFKLWQLMKELSKSPKVIYSKWYQGRATFFSQDLFSAMLRLRFGKHGAPAPTNRAAKEIIEALESDSPLSTKELKKITGLQGKAFATEYQRALNELFRNFLIVGFGEVEDGAFPSLAVGATRLIHEQLWARAEALSLPQAQESIERLLPRGSLFRKFFDRN